MVLGGSLIMFACILANECDVRPRLQRSKYGDIDDATTNRAPVATSYSYGWSFALAVLAFLASEASAVLCFTAFIRRFESEVRKG